MARVFSPWLRPRTQSPARPGVRRPRRPGQGPRLELLEDRCLLTTWADIARIINDNLPGVRGLVPGITNSTFQMQIPLVSSSLSQEFDPANKLLSAFPQSNAFDNPNLTIEDAKMQLMHDFEVKYCELTPETGSNDLLRLRKSLTLNANPLDIQLGAGGGSIGFDYFDKQSNGGISGSFRPTLQPVTVDVTFGVDVVGSTLQFFIANDSGLREPGIGGTGHVSGNMNIKNLLNVQVEGDATLNVSAALNWHRPDGQKLRFGDLNNAANITGGFTGRDALSFANVTLTSTVTDFLPPLTWTGAWGASVSSPDPLHKNQVNKTGSPIAPSNALSILGGITDHLTGITNGLSFLSPINRALNFDIPLVGKLGDKLGLGDLSKITGLVLPNIDTTGGDAVLQSVEAALNRIGIYIGIPPSPDMPSHQREQPQTVAALGSLIARIVNGERVDLLSFGAAGGDRWGQSLCFTILSLGVPGVADVHLDVCLGGYVGWDYYVGFGVDTTGFYIDPHTHIGVEGGVYAGIHGGLRVLGFDLASADGRIGLDAHAGLSLRNPDPSQGDRIYLDQILTGGNVFQSLVKARHGQDTLAGRRPA